MAALLCFLLWRAFLLCFFTVVLVSLAGALLAGVCPNVNGTVAAVSAIVIKVFFIFLVSPWAGSSLPHNPIMRLADALFDSLRRLKY